MRHQKHKNKLNMKPAHRKSLMKNLCTELIDHGKIKTTVSRCKALRSDVEKLVTLAKKDTVHARRLAFSKLNNRDIVNKLFTEVAPKFKDRAGGYTRTLKLLDGRVGDNAKMAYITFVD